MYHLFKQSRVYQGKPYCGPTSDGKPAEYETLEQATEAQIEFTRYNPVGWDIYDASTGELVKVRDPHDLLESLVVVKSMERKEFQCVVRLRTTMWSDGRGLNIKKSLNFLRRHCFGFNLLEEDTSAIGPDEVISRIVNFSDCEDGVYEVVSINESRDWETGHIDDYDYLLIPFDVNEDSK